MESIIEILAQYFSPTFKEKLKRSESLAVLIHKLENKESCLKVKLNEELSSIERKAYETKLSVLIAQKDKAIQLLVKNSQKH